MEIEFKCAKLLRGSTVYKFENLRLHVFCGKIWKITMMTLTRDLWDLLNLVNNVINRINPH